MGKEIISDFLVRLGFDGKQVIKGVAETERALARLKKAKLANSRQPKNVELDQAVKATKQRIQAEQLVTRIKERQYAKDAAERRKQLAQTRRLLRAKASLKRADALNVAGQLPDGRARKIRKQISAATNVEQVKNIRAEMSRIVKSEREVTRQKKRQINLSNAMSFSFKSILASLKNLARSWMSAFVIIGGAIASLKITQEFQALDAAMLAVSDSTESAARNVKYLKELSRNLPVDIQKAGDNYKNLLASGRESIGEQGVQELFTALSEFGTALQVDPERMDRGMQAISQMLNKGKLSAEEVRQQFAEQMPGGLQVFSRALNMTTEDLFEAIENGELLAKDTLPLVAKELARTARNNNALTNSLKTSRSQWTIFMNHLKLMFDGFGSTRLDRGVGSFTQALTKLTKILKPIAQVLFWVIGLVMDLVGILAKGVLSAFDPVLNIFDQLRGPLEAIGKYLNIADGATMSWLGHLAKFIVFANPITAAIALIGGVIEEIINLFTGDRQGVLAGAGDTLAERLSNGFAAKWLKQVGVWWDGTALPWFKEKATELAEVFRDAFKAIIPDWMVATPKKARTRGSLKRAQSKEDIPSSKNASTIPSWMVATPKKARTRGSLKKAQSKEDILNSFKTTRDTLLSKSGEMAGINPLERSQRPIASVVVNIDGEEKIKKVIKEQTTVEYSGAF